MQEEQNKLQKNYLKEILILSIIPVIIIVYVAITAWAPILLANPKYDFVYVTNCDIVCFEMYYEPKSIYKTKSAPAAESYGLSELLNPEEAKLTEGEIYYHHIKSNNSEKITYDDYKRLKLNKLQESKDGYRLLMTYENNSNFFGNNTGSNKWILSKGDFYKPLNLEQNFKNNRYYQFEHENYVRLLGWVEQ